MRVGILGAGPAGLFCAWLLARRGIKVTVFEAQSVVGGISRSFDWHGFTCDFGTHRLFTRDEGILRQLLAIVPMGRHIRRSQLYLRDKWLHDPVNITQLLYRYSFTTALSIAGSYIFRNRTLQEHSFNDFVHRKYGTALNQLFFGPYTEKLFGLDGDQIAAEYARRKVRIAGPLDSLRENTKRKFDYFYYPIRGGYGAILERVFQDIAQHVHLDAPVSALKARDRQIETVVYQERASQHEASFDQVISTLPLDVLAQLVGHSFELTYQSVDCIYLLVDRPSVSHNHWIYFMDKDIAINRLVEFKNLSAVDQPEGQTVLCAEVTSEFDRPDEQVVRDLVRCGLVKPQEVLDTMVLHEDHGYAVFDLAYHERLAAINQALGRYDNLHLIGRAAEFQHSELDDVYANALSLANRIAPARATHLKGEKTVTPEPTTPDVCAIVLTFNHYADTHECLESLSESDYENLRIVVVDNGSSDGTPAQVRANFPNVHVIETGHNLGVPWGYNVGFSWALRANAEYILMLNNDTTVHAQMVSHLVKAGQADSAAGILVPKILYYDDPKVVWTVGGRYRAFPPALVFRGNNQPSAEFDKPFHLEYAISCGLLIHRRAFEKAGLFDPGYFFYFDDWDFSHRVRAHGLHIAFVPEAEMWHKVSRSTRQKGKEALFWKVWGESSTRYYRRHGKPVSISLPVHVGYIMAREFIKGNGRMLKHFWQGVREGLSKPLGTIPQAEDVVLPPPSLTVGEPKG